MTTPYQKVVDNAVKLLSEWFDYVDFYPVNRTIDQLAEILACDALQKAGSTISIRWFDASFQESRIGGIENMMFDDLRNDPSIKEFYRSKLSPVLVREGNRYRVRETNIGQSINWGC